MEEAAAPERGGCSRRKEKRRALKKQKRREIRKDAAIKEREEKEERENDPEEQARIEAMEKEEAEAAERARSEFEERERLWLEAARRRKAQEEEEEARKEMELEESRKAKQGEQGGESDGDGEWEYIEEGPAEIIWKDNEIIVKKKMVKVPRRIDHQPQPKDDDDRPTSNPLPPQSAAFAAFKNAPSQSAQELLESVAQQTPKFGTEQDKAHCPFHLKTGACRFGNRCSRVHFYPDKSCTLLIKNMYTGPGLAWEQDEGLEYTDEEVDRCYEEFYEDVQTEFLKFGELVNFKVCRNGSFHLRGNVYVHYKSLDSSVLAYNSMNGRFFAGKQITFEFVGVTRWKIAICGEYMKSRLKTCSRGTACNFIHCFRNPGGDYEWADWDNPPPRFWVKKMAVLFGPPDETEYCKSVDTDDRECRYDKYYQNKRFKDGSISSRRSQPRERCFQYSGSEEDDCDGFKDRYMSHSSRQERFTNRKKRRISNEGEPTEELFGSSSCHSDRHAFRKSSSVENEAYHVGNEREKLVDDTEGHQRHSRKHRRDSSSRKRRVEASLDGGRKAHSSHAVDHYKKPHSSRHSDSDRGYHNGSAARNGDHPAETTSYISPVHVEENENKCRKQKSFEESALSGESSGDQVSTGSGQKESFSKSIHNGSSYAHDWIELDKSKSSSDDFSNADQRKKHRSSSKVKRHMMMDRIAEQDCQEDHHRTDIRKNKHIKNSQSRTHSRHSSSLRGEKEEQRRLLAIHEI